MCVTKSDKRKELNRMLRESDAIFNSVAVRSGMTDTMFWVLYVLCNHKEKMTQAQITDTWYFPRQTINSVVKKLRENGLVELQHIPGKRADKAVILTDVGNAFCESYVYPLMQAEQSAFDGLTTQEQDTLLALLKKQNGLYRQYADKIFFPEGNNQ